MPDAPFEAALALVENATSVPELRGALCTILRLYGFKHGLYSQFGRNLDDHQAVFLLTTYPEDWIFYYQLQNYSAIDPAARVADHSIVPVDWQHLDKSAPAVRRLFDESIEAGIGRRGLSIPLRGVRGERALFVVTSDESDADWRRIRRGHMAHMQGIAAALYDKACRLAPPAARAMRERLSARECECLQWAACGKTIEETSAILTLSCSAVRSYLDAARHKLDCVTKTQAVARALRLGLIDI